MDFFLSHAGPDAEWAEWIGQQLVEADYTVELDVWDWAAGTNFMIAMQRALDRARRMIALLSPAYFERTWTRVEQHAAFVEQAQTRGGYLVPVIIIPCDEVIPKLLRPLISIDLVGLSEQQARARLLKGLAGPRRPAPGEKVRFPGGAERTAYPAGLPPLWNLPARNLFFTGREALLDELGRRLNGDDSRANRVAVSALHGVGGVGKSHLALEYAWRHAADYRAVWWINAEDPTGIEAALVELATALNLPIQGGTAAIPALLRSELAKRKGWLLLYDNVEDVDQIRHLPEGGHVIVTSRNGNVSQFMPALPVGAFTRRESIALLRRRVPHSTVEDADRIASALADLPLSVSQAAAYLATTGVTPTDYLNRIYASASTRSRGNGKGPLDPSIQPRLIGPADETGLAATVAVAVDVLTVDDPAALDLLYQLAYLAPEPIPLTAAPGSTEIGATGGLVIGDPATSAELVQAISRLDLARSSGTRLLIHRRVQRLLYDRLPPSRRQAVLTRTLRLLGTAAPGDPRNPSTWPTYAELTPHLQAVTAYLEELAVGDPAAFRRLLLDTCRYLTRSGQIATVRILSEHTYSRFQRTLGDDHADTLWSAHNLANALRQGWDYQAARVLDEETLTRRRRIHGEDHPDTLSSAGNLAHDLRRLGDYNAARVLDEDTLARRRRVLGDDHPESLYSANNFASDLFGTGNYQAACALHKDTLIRLRRVLGDDHPDTLWSAGSLASDLRGLGDFHTARDLDEDTLARRRRVLGDDHPDTLWSAGSLASDLRGLEGTVTPAKSTIAATDQS